MRPHAPLWFGLSESGPPPTGGFRVWASLPVVPR
jgi:hypothetical protein